MGADTVSAFIPIVPAGTTKAARAAEKSAREASEKAVKETAREAAQKKVDDAFKEIEKTSGKKRNKKTPNGCKPCIPPVGTLAYEIATLRKRGRHSRECENHVKLWVVNQSPYPTCKCFWNFYLNLDNFTKAPSDAIKLDDSEDGCPPSQSEVAGGGPIK